MKKSILCFLLMLALLSGSSLMAGNEGLYRYVVRLNDGRELRGHLLGRPADSLLRMETKEGLYVLIPRRDVSDLTLEQIPEEEFRPAIDSSVVKRPQIGIAMLCSYFLPGGGQYYNKEFGKGVLLTAACVTGFVGLLDSRMPEWTAATLYVGSWLYSLVDATVVSIRRQRSYDALHRPGLRNDDYSLQLRPALNAVASNPFNSNQSVRLAPGFSLKITL